MRDPDGYREDERDRQRKCREARRASPVVRTDRPGVTLRVTAGHAQPWAVNQLDLKAKVLGLWDREAARSRATLERFCTRFSGEIEAFGGTNGGRKAPCHAPP